jgi:hypothetical protein
MGLEHQNIISGTRSDKCVIINNSFNIEVININLTNCSLHINNSSNVTLTQLAMNTTLGLYNAFNLTISASSLLKTYVLYWSDFSCQLDANHYLTVFNTTYLNTNELSTFGVTIDIYHGFAYTLHVTLDSLTFSGYYYSVLPRIYYSSSYSLVLNNITISNSYDGLLVNFTDSPLLHHECNNNNTNVTSPIHSIVITNSYIHNNVFGLYIKFYFLSHSPRIVIKGCTVSDNSDEEGIGMGFVSDFYSQPPSIYVSDTRLIANVRNGIYFTKNVSLTDVTITDSQSTGLYIIQSEVTINGTLNVINNVGAYGGGVSLLEGSHLRLLPNSKINAEGNHAVEKGGAFYSDAVFTDCFLNPEPYNAPNISVSLFNNTAAKLGADVFGINFRDCKYIEFDYDGPINQTTPPTTLCFCESHSSSDCLNDNIQVNIFAGQQIKFSIIQFGKGYTEKPAVSSGSVSVYLNDKYVFTKNINPYCTPLQYTPIANSNSGVLQVMNEVLSAQFKIKRLNLRYSILPCPFGFSISPEDICDCNPDLFQRHESDFHNITCDIETLEITHDGDIWIGPYNTTNDLIAAETNPGACLINEHCRDCKQSNVTFMLNDTDLQCPPYKSGPLCRLCANGSSLLLGSNECEECDNNNNIALIIVFVIMGILLVVLLIVLNLTVSVGTINGLLFTANIIKLYTPVFVGFYQQPYPFFHQILAWLNLDFGIETCFYSGMDRYGKEWLQFVFPFYVWSIMIIIIIAARKSSKVSKLVGTNAVPVLATLLLLSYTKLLSTIVTIFDRQKLTLYCNESSPRTITVWYEDPTVKYASGKHLALFLFALLVFIVFCIPYTLFLLLIPFVEKYLSKYRICSYWNKLKPIIDAYCGPMKDEYRFWPGVLVLARIPLLLAVSLVDSVVESHEFLLSILLSILVIIISLAYCLQGVYQKHLHNIIETWFLFILFIMVGLSAVSPAIEEYNMFLVVWFNTSVAVLILSFFGIISYHMYLRIGIKCIFKKHGPSLNNQNIVGSYDINRHDSITDLFEYSSPYQVYDEDNNEMRSHQVPVTVIDNPRHYELT